MDSQLKSFPWLSLFVGLLSGWFVLKGTATLADSFVATVMLGHVAYHIHKIVRRTTSHSTY